MPQRTDRACSPENAPEHALERGLTGLMRMAADLGANSLAVLVIEAESLEIAFHQTPAGKLLPAGTKIPCGREMCAELDRIAEPVSARSPVAHFLTSAVAPGANSFLLFRCRIQTRGVATVLGFEARELVQDSIPSHVADSLNLAALAAWSVKEVSRLHKELRTANCRFAGRKLVERARCVLQSEGGMNEQQAYEYLRRLSRQRRITMSRLAEDLLAHDLQSTNWREASALST
jgi:hypothetical protein